MALSAPPVLGLTAGASAASVAFASFTPDANTLYICCVTGRGTLSAEPTCSDDVDGAWTAITGSYIDAGDYLGKLFYKVTGSSPSAIVVTVGSASATRCGGMMVKWASGYSTDFTNIATGSNAAGDPAATLPTTPAAGSTGIAFYGSNAGGAITEPSGFTELAGSDTTLATSVRVQISYDTASAAQSISFTGTGGDSYAIYLEIKEPSAGTYTITATGGSYAVTGTAASLEFGRLVGATAGSYAITGTAASLEFGYKVAAAAGSYALTGTAASLEFGYKVTASAGSYTINGTAATLTYAGLTNRTITADSGTYAISGTAATLDYAPVVEARQGGGWLSDEQIKADHEHRKKRRERERELEETIITAYQRLTGKITEPPIIEEAQGNPVKLAVHAEKLAKQLVEKSKSSDRMRAKNKAIIADLQRQANAIMQEEEEAIVSLLFH